MKNSTKSALVISGVALILLGFVNWYLFKQKSSDPKPEEIVQPDFTPAPGPPRVEADKPTMHFPISPILNEKTQAGALPSLQVSDTAIRNALADLFTKKTFLQFFYPSEIIRRIVVTVDNLPRETVSVQLIPLKPVGEQFLVKQDGNLQYIDPANFNRYTPYVDLIQNIDTKKVVAVYRYFYPLFQQQFKELGYPDGYFNDRLIEVMDYMINFQEATEPVQLIQKHVLYQYADSDLEHMTAGGKFLTRLGHDNTGKLKQKLREIRAELVNQK